MELGNTSLFHFTVAGVEDELRVTRFKGHEGISRPFVFTIDVACKNFDLDVDGLLQKPAQFLINNPEAPCYFNGYLHTVAIENPAGDFCRYAFELVPKCTFLLYRINLKIFQQLTTDAIIKQVLENAGLTSDDFKFQITSPLPPRVYCTQYQESDLDFIHRLMAEDGLHYFFEQTNDKSVMVISDSHYSFKPLPVTPELRYHRQSGQVITDYFIDEFYVGAEAQPNTVVYRDYNFEQPRQDLETKESTDQGQLEVYQHNVSYQSPEAGKQKAKTTIKAYQSATIKGKGVSNCPFASAGHFFLLQDYEDPRYDHHWLLTKVFHQGWQPQVLDEYAGSSGSGYTNQLFAIPKDHEYKTLPTAPKPKIRGSQTAFVTGPKGEEIYCDQYGRIKIQFHWDRDGQYDESSSCWVRVKQNWAGNKWGNMQLPRIGTEVLVKFINGDPDHPIVMGSLYNGKDKPPYQLPDHKTRTTMKTNSSPGGEGFNEIRLEDKKGSEQIFIHAEKDLDIQVKNDQRETIGNERHLIVDNNSYEYVKGHSHQKVDGSHFVKVDQNSHTTIDDSLHGNTGTQFKIEAGNEIHIKAGDNLVFDAGVELTLKGGGSFAKLDPSGVTLQGPTLKMNEGGSPGSGSGASLAAPSQANQADQSRPGQTISPTPPNLQQLVSSIPWYNTQQLFNQSTAPLTPVAEQLANQQANEQEVEPEVVAIKPHIQLPYVNNSSHFWIGINSIFGNDIPLAAIDELREQAQGGLPAPDIELGDMTSGQLGAFAEGKIYISQDLANKAVKDPMAKWLLMIVLAEEYGHYVDYLLRTSADLAIKDAPGDEGRIFAADFIYFNELLEQNYHFADLTLNTGQTVIADLAEVPPPIRAGILEMSKSRPGNDIGTIKLNSGKQIEAEFFKIRWGGSVHETITEAAAKQASVPFDDALRKGVAWPDVPCEDIDAINTCYVNLLTTAGLVHVGKATSDLASKVTGDEKHIEFNDEDNIAFVAHYGDNQYWHSMSFDSSLSNDDIKQLILKQAKEWYGEAVKNKGKTIKRAITRSVRDASRDRYKTIKEVKIVTADKGLFYMGKVLHMVQDSYSFSHTIRDGYGNILYFQDYTKQGEKAHGHHDKWNDAKKIEDIPGAGEALKASAKILSLYANGKSAEELIGYLDKHVYRLNINYANKNSGKIRRDTSLEGTDESDIY